MLLDEDVAQDTLAAYVKAERERGVLDKADTGGRETFVGFTREIQLLTTLINAVFQHIVVTGSMFGGRPGTPPRLPVPRSRFEELVERFDNDYSDDLAARFGVD